MRLFYLRSLYFLSMIFFFVYIYSKFLIVSWDAKKALSFTQFHNQGSLALTMKNFDITKESKINRNFYYILDWTYFYGTPIKNGHLTEECPSLPCRLVSDRRYLRRSSAVVFHVPDIKKFDWPSWRSPYQYYVFQMWESPSTLSRMAWTDLENYAGEFNLTMTYRSDSDIFAPYGYLKREEKSISDYDFATRVDRIVKRKSKLVAWFSSHCATSSQREDFVRELAKYVPIDIFGSCGTLKCEKESIDCDELDVLSRYKFYLSLENSVCKDYVTEKFYARLAQNVVPIVLGGAGNFLDVDDWRHPRFGFILVSNFSNVEKLAEYLFYLDSHPREYAKYFQWKRNYKAIASWSDLFSKAYCNLCRKLIRANENFSMNWYKNISHWWHDKFECDDGLVARFLEV